IHRVSRNAREIPSRTRDGRAADRTILGLAELSPNEVRENALWDRAVPLSAEERQRYCRIWQRLRRENAPFRVIEGDTIISASIEVYDDMLLSCLTTEWSRAARAIGDAMAKSLGDPRGQVGDLVLFGRLRKLIDAGKGRSRHITGRRSAVVPALETCPLLRPGASIPQAMRIIP